MKSIVNKIVQEGNIPKWEHVDISINMFHLNINVIVLLPTWQYTVAQLSGTCQFS